MLGGTIHKLINCENIIFKEGHQTLGQFQKSNGVCVCYFLEISCPFFFFLSLAIRGVCVCVNLAGSRKILMTGHVLS